MDESERAGARKNPSGEPIQRDAQPAMASAILAPGQSVASPKTDEPPSLRSQLGELEYAERLQGKLREYHFLITREAAAHLLELEASGPRVSAQTLRQASLSPLPAQVRARIERIFPPKIFDRGAQVSRIQRLSVTDQSGPGTLVLYDAACDIIDAQLLLGDLVQAGPVRARGGELHLLPGGSARLLQKGPRERIVAAVGTRGATIGNFEGMVSEFGGDFPVRKTHWRQSSLGGTGADGKGAGAAAPVGLMSSFTLKDDSGSARVVLWTSPGLQGVLRPGMRAQVENGIRRGSEIHISEAGRVVFARQSDEERMQPAIESIEVQGETVRVKAGGREVVFPSLEDACARLGAGGLPPGVSAKTIIDLKKAQWMGKPLPLKWEEKPV